MARPVQPFRSSEPPESRAERVRQPEIMDGPLPYGEARRALRDLDRVTRWTLAVGTLRRVLIPRLSERPEGDEVEPRAETVELLDLGTGSGYPPAEIARAAERCGVRVRTTGIDRRLAHLVIGRKPYAGQRRVVASADALPFRDDCFHWAFSHLLFHHFTGPENRRIVAEMRRCARRGAVIVDLRPSALAARLVRLLFPLLQIGHVAREDGLLSVLQAWGPEEVRSLAREHRWPVAELRRRFPFRWSLVLGP